MTTPYSWEVTPNGAFTASIPIRIPPGIAGVQPKLGLAYNSQTGNGIAGMGWNFTGLSVITRCPKTFAVDGERGGVNMDANDRLCLDGQRLILRSGTYGGEGAEYATEIYNGSKIIGTTLQSTDPNRTFKVYTKAGETLEYLPFAGGYDSTGRNCPSGMVCTASTGLSIDNARLFVLSKVTDAKGNYWQAYYVMNTAQGEFYPKALCYTGNSRLNQAPKNCVEFGYGSETDRFGPTAPRPDKSNAYIGGYAFNNSVRLSGIRTLINANVAVNGTTSYTITGTTVTQYKLIYINQGSNLTKRSLLENIQECDATENCLTPIKFWHSSSNTLRALSGVYSSAQDFCANGSSSYGGCNDEDNYKYIYYADLNGDGLKELCYRSDSGLRCVRNNDYSWNPNNSNTIITDICSNQTSGYYSSGTCRDSTNYSTIQFIDTNVDGKADLVYRSNEGIRLFINSAFSFSSNTVFNVCSGNSPNDGGCNDMDNYQSIQYPDINGDGAPELCYRADSGIRCYWGRFTTWDLSNPLVTDICSNGSSNYGVCNDSDNHLSIKFIDFNGDGKADLIYRSDQGIQLWLSNGTNFVNRISFDLCANGSTSYGGCNDSDNYSYIHYADVNGDGLVDLCYRSDTGIRCYFYTGVGWDSTNPIVTDICANNSLNYGVCNDADNFSTINFVDMTGDGKADLVYRSDQGLRLWRSTGTSFIEQPLDESGYFEAIWNAICSNTSPDCNTTSNYNSIRFFDIDGDGFNDIVYRGNNGIKHYIQYSKLSRDPAIAPLADVLGAIYTGNNFPSIYIKYKSISQRLSADSDLSNDIYVPDTVAQYPTVLITPPLYVVGRVAEDAYFLMGSYGKNNSYRYGGARSEIGTGRGFLGFAWQESWAENWARTGYLHPGPITRITYGQTWPCIGTPLTITTRRPDSARTSPVSLNHTTFNPRIRTLNDATPRYCGDAALKGQSVIPFTQDSITEQWEFDASLIQQGPALPGKRVTTQIDAFGNPTLIQEITLNPNGSDSGYSRTTTNSYDPDPDKARRGRLIRSQVTHTQPAQ